MTLIVSSLTCIYCHGRCQAQKQCTLTKWNHHDRILATDTVHVLIPCSWEAFIKITSFTWCLSTVPAAAASTLITAWGKFYWWDRWTQFRTVGPSYEVKILVLYSTGVNNSFIYTEIIDNFNLHMDVVRLGPLFSLPNLRLDFLGQQWKLLMHCGHFVAMDPLWSGVPTQKCAWSRWIPIRLLSWSECCRS